MTMLSMTGLITYENTEKLVEDLERLAESSYQVDLWKYFQQLIPEESTPQTIADILSIAPTLFDTIPSLNVRLDALYYLVLAISDRCWVLNQSQSETKPVDAEIWNKINVVFDTVITLAKETGNRSLEALSLKEKAYCLSPHAHPSFFWKEVNLVIDELLHLLLDNKNREELFLAGQQLAATGSYKIPEEDQANVLNEDEVTAFLQSRNLLLEAHSPIYNPEGRWADYRRTAYENEVIGIWLENQEFQAKALFNSINSEVDGSPDADLPLPLKERAREAAALYRELGDTVSATSIEQRAALVSPPSSRITWGITIATLALLVGAFFKGMDGILTFVVLGFVILIHEAGHWIAATFCGIPIEKFCIGVGAKIYSFTWGRTLIELRLFPLMGYVQPASMTKFWFEQEKLWLAARNNSVTEPSAPSAVANSSPMPRNRLYEEVKSTLEYVSGHRRTLFYLGGVLVNFIAAVICFWIFLGDASPKRAIYNVTCIGPVLISKLPAIMHDAVKSIPPRSEQKFIRKEIKTAKRGIFNVLAIQNTIILWFNLIPVPPLDGFRIVENSAAMILRRELPHRVGKIIGVAGWVVFGVLIILNIFLMIRNNIAALLG